MNIYEEGSTVLLTSLSPQPCRVAMSTESTCLNHDCTQSWLYIRLIRYGSECMHNIITSHVFILIITVYSGSSYHVSDVHAPLNSSCATTKQMSHTWLNHESRWYTLLIIIIIILTCSTSTPNSNASSVFDKASNAELSPPRSEPIVILQVRIINVVSEYRCSNCN